MLRGHMTFGAWLQMLSFKNYVRPKESFILFIAVCENSKTVQIRF